MGDLTLNDPPCCYPWGISLLASLLFVLKINSLKLTRWFANTAGSCNFFFSNKSNCRILSHDLDYVLGNSTFDLSFKHTKWNICHNGSLYQKQTTDKQSKEFTKSCLQSRPARREWSVEPDLLEELTPGITSLLFINLTAAAICGADLHCQLFHGAKPFFPTQTTVQRGERERKERTRVSGECWV